MQGPQAHKLSEYVKKGAPASASVSGSPFSPCRNTLDNMDNRQLSDKISVVIHIKRTTPLGAVRRYVSSHTYLKAENGISNSGIPAA